MNWQPKTAPSTTWNPVSMVQLYFIWIKLLCSKTQLAVYISSYLLGKHPYLLSLVTLHDFYNLNRDKLLLGDK